jgi:hypothetical protein
MIEARKEVIVTRAEMLTKNEQTAAPPTVPRLGVRAAWRLLKGKESMS